MTTKDEVTQLRQELGALRADFGTLVAAVAPHVNGSRGMRDLSARYRASGAREIRPGLSSEQRKVVV